MTPDEDHTPEDLEELTRELESIFQEAEYRKDRGGNPEFIFMDLVEELEVAVEAPSKGIELSCDDDDQLAHLQGYKKQLASTLGVDYTVPYEWQKQKLKEIFDEAEHGKESPVDNETIFEKLKRRIAWIIEKAYDAVDKIWEPDELEHQNKKLAGILEVYYPSEIDWLKHKLERIFSEAQEDAADPEEEEDETDYQGYADRIINYIEASYFYHRIEGASDYIDSSLKTLKEIWDTPPEQTDGWVETADKIMDICTEEEEED